MTPETLKYLEALLIDKLAETTWELGEAFYEVKQSTVALKEVRRAIRRAENRAKRKARREA